MDDENKRHRYELLRGQLDQDRQSFIPIWKECADYTSPRRPRFTISDVNRGDRRSQKIIDSTPTLASRTARAGMMGGITSPARPWFRLSTPNTKLTELSSVKLWLQEVDDRMVSVFSRSNLYNVLSILYGDLINFGTPAMMIEEDFDQVVRFYSFPIGSFYLSNNELGLVDCFMRDFRMTVRQMVKKFGYDSPQDKKINWDKFSVQVKNLWDQGLKETWIDVCHVISLNEDYDSRKIESKFKKYASCYFERGNQTTGASTARAYEDKILSEKGYDYFPVFCPRWETTGEDAYATSWPALDALGDNKQLQLGEKRIMQAIEKIVNPPMTGPSSLRNTKVSILPGDITYDDSREGQRGFRPAHEVSARINELEEKQQQVRSRIKRAFFEDLFLMLANSDRRQITAREVEERHEEKLLALGPVLERLNIDLLDPLIDATFSIMLAQGLIPPPPEELQGVDLKVDYISIMHQAQKSLGISGMERFSQFVQGIAQAKPEIIDKVDTDQLVDIYSDNMGINPSIVRSDEDVASIREGRAKAQQAQAQAENLAKTTGAVKNLAQANTSGENALTGLLQMANAGNPMPN